MAIPSVICIFSIGAIMLHILLSFASASTSMIYIDAVCGRVHDQAFCTKKLTSYPPTSSSTGQIPMAEAVIGLGISHAEKTMVFVDETTKKDPKLSASFVECHKAYLAVVASLKGASLKLKTIPDTAHSDIRASNDHIKRVTELLGKNSDMDSTTLKEMTIEMEKLLDIAAGAADAVADDNENRHRRV